MAEPTLYLVDGYNVLHASAFGSREELVDRLAGYLAVRGARGVVVFDGVGEDLRRGPLAIRFADSADRLLERLAAGNRLTERVCLVSSDHSIRLTAGQEVAKRASKEFAAALAGEAEPAGREPGPRSQIEDALDPPTRERLERWRRRRA